MFHTTGNNVLLRGLAFIGALILCGIVTGCSGIQETRGLPTKEAVVEAYLKGLERKDDQAILALIPETHDAKQEVQEKIVHLGGHALHNVNIRYRSEFGPRMAMVTIEGKYTDVQGSDHSFVDDIILQQPKQHWYLMLGRDIHAPQLPTAIPIQPSPIR